MKRYPFKFLDAYNRDDTDFFFGRDDEITAMYEMLFQSSVLLVYGASGTGKTSLIQCGLAGKFDRHDWLPIAIRRGLDLNTSLKKALNEATGGAGTATETSGWIEKIKEKNTPAAATRPLTYFDRIFKAIYLNSFKPVYLIFDQLEELFILGSSDEQQEFIDSVVKILNVEQPVKIILSIREEYLGDLTGFEKALPQLFRKKLRVEPMNSNKVAEVIRRAIENEDSNVSVAPGETDQIATGIFDKIKANPNSKTIQLTYLQVFLDKLYIEITEDEEHKAEAVFSLAELNKIGDFDDILQNFLDEQVARISAKLSEQDEQITDAAIWKLLSPFATLDGTKEPISKAGLYEKLPNMSQAAVNAVLEALINARVLRYDENEDLHELAHDALAKRIAGKRTDEEIGLLEAQRLIKTQVAVKQEARALFTEKQLLFLEQFLEKIQLSEEERKLIDDSRSAVLKSKKAKGKEKNDTMVCWVSISRPFVNERLNPLGS